MRSKLILLAAAVALSGCQHSAFDMPEQGLTAVNAPVVASTNYAIDLAAPGGSLAPSEAARLDGWFGGLGVQHGDAIYVDGAYSDLARLEVARIAGQYGLMVTPGAPVTTGQVAPDTVRVVVSRREASVPGCPNWDRASNPNFSNQTMPNFGCGVNTNLAAMVANPQDLIHGQAGSGVGDAVAGAKAVQMYRDWPLTGILPGQELRPLKSENTKKDDQ